MKMMAGLILLAVMQVSAKGYSQLVTVSEKNAPLEKVFKLIEKQSGYVFFCDYTLLKQAKPVSIDLKNVSLQTALETCFKDQALTYSIAGKNIVVHQKQSAPPKLTESLGAAFAASVIDVRGRIVDDKGAAAENVTVSVKGNSGKRTMTNANGEFLLKGIDASATLLFTSINLEAFELKVNGQNTVFVTLKTKINELSSVVLSVNTGFQTLAKEKSTGSVVTISAAQLEQRYNPNLLDQMEGRVPGLVTYATGLSGTANSTARSVTIRGVSTLASNVSALIVVDGLPIEGTINDINPYDVESIAVLKDAAAATLYGARASNGVIVITTKKAKASRTTIEVSGDVTVKQKPDYNYLQYMSGSQQVDFESRNSAFYFNGADGAVADPVGTQSLYINTYNFPTSPVAYLYYRAKQGLITTAALNDSLALLKSRDFVSQYRDKANLNEIIQQYNVAIRSSGNKYQSSLVLNYKNSNKGIINARNYNLNLFYKGTYNAAKWLDVDFGVNTVFNNDKSQYDLYATSPFNVPAYTQLVDASGKHVQYTTSDNSAYNNITNTTGFKPLNYNHLDELALNFTKNQQLNTRMYVHANTRIFSFLKSQTMFQYEDFRTDVNTYSEANSYFARREYDVFIPAGSTTSLLPSGGRLVTTATRSRNYTARQQFDFNRTYGKHTFNAIAGLEFRQTFSRGQNAMYLGYDDQLLTNLTFSTNLSAIRAAANAQSVSAMGYWVSMYNDYITYFSGGISVSETRHRYSSGYADATYTYDNRYNVFGSIRKDVADLFGADPSLKGRPFYAVGLGWNLHNEKFMLSVPDVTFLKLRASYGLTGNTNTSTSKYVTANSSTNAYSQQPWLTIANPANDHLTWELTRTTNIGIDYGFFNSRLSGAVDIYRKASDHLLANKTIDATEGFTSVALNSGEALNKGIEMSANYKWLVPRKRGDLGISTSYTLAFNQNNITKADNVYNSSAYLLVSPSGGRAYQQGRPVNSLYSYAYAGINTNGQPEWILADKSRTSGAVNNASDMVFSGTLDPKLTMSFTPEFTYKGFNLSALFVYFGGHVMRADQPNVSIYPNTTLVANYGALPNNLLNSWTPTNTNTLIPGVGQYYPTSQATNSYYFAQLAFADKFVQPADFVKMRTLTLSYVMPAVWARKIAASTVRLRFQVNNAWTVWTKNKIGVDPEANNAWQGSYGGTTSRYLPLQASFIFGANVNF